jgi:hypothetical protein
MIIETTKRRAEPGAPILRDPVEVTLSVPVYYDDGKDLILSKSKIFCERVFANTVLKVLDAMALEKQYGVVHVGVYNARKARRKDGTEIKPTRWSNHAYGLAIDFKGWRTKDGEYLKVSADKTMAGEVIDRVRVSVEAAKRKPETVDEGGWAHLGIWP